MAKSNKGRKFFATTATAALVASAIVPVASAAQINDINSVSSYAQEAVQNLVDRGVITGDQKGNFNPKSTVTRAEAATVLSKALELVATDDEVNFSDVKKGAWYYDAIAKVVINGIFQGQGAGKFNPTGNLTRSEAAIIFVDAFGLEGEGDLSTFSDAAQVKSWAEEALSIAVANGVVKGDNGKLNPNSPITKQDFAVMFERAEASIDPETVLVNALEELKTTTEALVETVTADSIAAAKTAVADVKEAIADAEEALEAAKAAEVLTEEDVKAAEEAIAAAKAALEKAEKAVASYEESLTVAKVESVTATNLKEVVVTFNSTVDKESAEDKANYALKSGKAIQSVTLAEDNKTVTITVVGTLANNKVDAVSVSNVKSGSRVLNDKNVEFTTVDNTLPEVTSIKSLGTKSVRVVFSEPVTDLKQNNFTLDGKTYYGKVTLGANNRSVILTPYSATALSVGDHKLAITGVKDYAGFVSLTSTQDFTVVEDKEAPTVTETSATLESVTLTYSEEVDVETISAAKVYWKSGDSKKTAASYEVLADNKVKYFFATDKTLPTGSVDIYVEGIKDYSGNEIAKDTKVTVTPEIDQTRPEVRKVEINNATGTEIKVTFSKAINEVSAKVLGNYTVTDSKGKVVSVQNAKLDPSDSKSVIVTLYRGLTVGENTITVKNVKDATKLQNTMLDFTGKVAKSDKDAPKFDFAVNKDGRQVVLKFDKKMDIDTLTNHGNYFVTIDGEQQTLTPAIADISVLQDATAVAITFTETISDKEVVFASGASTSSSKTNVNKLTVLGLKDTNGNLLYQFAQNGINGVTNAVDLFNDTRVGLVEFDSVNHADKVAELVDTKTIEVKFDTGINAAETGAFTAKVNGTTVAIDSVVVDGTSTVTLKFKDALKTDANGLTIDVDYSKLVNIAGNKGVNPVSGVLHQISTSALTYGLLDSVVPTPVFAVGETEYDVNGNKIVITYSEVIEPVLAATQDLRDTDFIVTRVSDNKVLKPTEFEAVVLTGTNTIEITLEDSRTDATAYTVTVKDAKYFTDRSGNEIADSNGKSKLVASSGSQSLATAKAAAALATANAETAKTAFTTAGGVVAATEYVAVENAITLLNAAVASNVTADIEAATIVLNTAKATLDTKTTDLNTAAAALAAAKADAATAKADAATAQLVYLTAGGLTTDAEYVAVVAAITDLNTAITSDVTADIVAKTTALKTAIAAL